MTSNIISLPGNRPAQAAISRATSPGSKVHQQSLGHDEDAARRVDLVHPAEVECRPRDAPMAVGVRQPARAEGNRLRQVDGQPADTAVVDAPESGLEPFAERDDGAVRMLTHEPTHLVVEPERPERVRFARPAEMPFEGIVDRVADLDRLRIREQCVGPAGVGGAVVERPEQGFRDAPKCNLLSHARGQQA